MADGRIKGFKCLGSKWEHPVNERTAGTHPNSQNRMLVAVVIIQKPCKNLACPSITSRINSGLSHNAILNNS